MAMLSILILTYNTKELTNNCIVSLEKNYKKELEEGYFETTIVDNHSTDETVKTIRQWQLKNKSIQLIENSKNYGFAKGINIGAVAAKGKYLLFLNSDTQVDDRSFLHMTNYMEENVKTGVLGAKLQNEDGSAQKTAGSFYTPFSVLLMLLGLERIGLIRKSPKKIEPVDWVSGGAMMVRTDLFKKLKGLDENFFMYMEDMEFCKRVNKSGSSIIYFPHCKIIHKEHGSGNRAFAIEHIYLGLLYYFQKHGNVLSYFFVRFALRCKAIALILLGTITKNKYLQKTYEKALAVC